MTMRISEIVAGFEYHNWLVWDMILYEYNEPPTIGAIEITAHINPYEKKNILDKISSRQRENYVEEEGKYNSEWSFFGR